MRFIAVIAVSIRVHQQQTLRQICKDDCISCIISLRCMYRSANKGWYSWYSRTCMFAKFWLTSPSPRRDCPSFFQMHRTYASGLSSRAWTTQSPLLRLRLSKALLFKSAENSAQRGQLVQIPGYILSDDFCSAGDQALKMTTTVAHVQAKEVLPHVIRRLGSNQVQTSQSYTEFDLIHRLDALSSFQTDALGLHGGAAFHMRVTLPSEFYYGGSYQPKVKIEAHSNSRRCSEAFSGAILSQISKICNTFFADHWPCETQFDTLEFLADLYKHVQARIPLLGAFCVVCGCAQEHVGHKLLPCSSEACKIAFNEHGTGADLRDIYSRPVIADLLITMASAECHYITRCERLSRSKFFPLQQMYTTQNGWEYLQAFRTIPAVAAMAKESNLQSFLHSIGSPSELPRIQLMRSILNGYQGHLMQLQESDKFPMMATEYQFMLCQDSPSKEAAFAQLKEKLGSHFLFHGSPFYNWHSILREGLKDMSRTSLAQYMHFSQGIYLAENSGRSAGFCGYEDNYYSNGRSIPAYPNSIFGREPWCIALCEVIGDSSTTNDVRVEFDADRVITRYLFVYQSSTSNQIPIVLAKDLQEICEKSGKTQAALLDAVKKALNEL